MAKPPVNPLLTHDGKPTNYFEVLARWASEYVKKDGIMLNFKGYKETLLDYANVNEDELDKLWKLAKELNTWAEYFSSIANLIQKLYLDAETEKNERKSMASVEADEKKVANGDRLSNKDARVVEARKKRNTLKSFHEELEAKVKFLERAHYHCKATYDAKTKSTSIPHYSSYSNVG
ncbi:hypothetical protein NDS46_30955 (plasmid) [Paenibacillus thiaminolyticus]|uniref:hypothetical protein n=1 Tax=Paenibacillus thiaminolyticus TaxID=49283 RepID=UPI0023312947|nr:hypothetical protein [Paenibacillus thiaminolyticus]WCF11380.1 hypothetical protein NDS46_30955 [Paenibacillus thiaminolyticus]